jgi:hypothetical protein
MNSPTGLNLYSNPQRPLILWAPRKMKNFTLAVIYKKRFAALMEPGTAHQNNRIKAQVALGELRLKRVQMHNQLLEDIARSWMSDS